MSADQMGRQQNQEDTKAQLLTKKPQQSILILGANNSASNAKEMILAGAIDYLNAPIQPELLIQRCNVALRREYFFISQEQFQEKEVALTAAKNRALCLTNFQSCERVVDLLLYGMEGWRPNGVGKFSSSNCFDQVTFSGYISSKRM